jgi:cation diffusion facilitator family transporter
MDRVELQRRESHSLTASLVLSVVMGALGVVWGITTGSGIVLFDGVYTIFGTTLTGVSMLAGRAAGSAPTRTFPFGLVTLVPVAVIIQGAALLGALVYAATDAVGTIRAGGTEVSPGPVAIYGLVTFLCAGVVTWWLLSRREGSDLVAAEAEQWRASCALSAVIVVGAGLAALMGAFGWSGVKPYADPALVIVVAVMLLPVPLRMMRAGLLEVLEAAPPAALRANIDEAVERARTELGLPEPLVRATKTGTRVYLEVVFLVPEGTCGIAEEDHVRHLVIDALEPLGYEVWANVEVTMDPTLAD